MPSFNTIGYKVTNAYLQSCFSLDEKSFYNLLSENVEVVHITNDQERKEHKEIGRDKVMNLYKRQFFDVTRDFDILEVTIRSNELKPEFICKVSENKSDSKEKYKAEYLDKTKLHIIDEKGEWKIEKLISEVTKKILSPTN